MNKGFALKSFLIIVGLLLVGVLIVFYFQKNDKELSNIEAVTGLYLQYIEERNIEGFEYLMTEEMSSNMQSAGTDSILCLSSVSDYVSLEEVRLKNSDPSRLEVIISDLEWPIEIALKEEDGEWKIESIFCPSVRIDNELEISITETDNNFNEEIIINTEEIDSHPDEEITPVLISKENLALRLGIDISEIRLRGIEQVLFSDSTLGTSKPGEVVYQEMTPGYIIILGARGVDYRYHANNDVTFFIPLP